MGAATCKNPKSTEQKEDSKKITIGVFGLDNAGKTSTVKAIEGAPTKDVDPTMSSVTSKVPYPTTGKGGHKSQERITIIDVSGDKRFRERSWSEFYKQIHGLIFVIDASEKKRIMENRKILDELLENKDLKDKPILILANKQDRRGAIDTEDHIKDKLQIEELQRKHKIEFCTALPGEKNKVDDSIRQGFAWLIRTIENNYTQLNSLVNNTTHNSRAPRPTERKSQMNNRRTDQKSDQSDDDDVVGFTRPRIASPSLNKKPPDYRSIINSTKLPNLDLHKPKPKASGHQTYSESDNDDGIPSRSRPNISHSDYEKTDRNQPFSLPNLTTAGSLNKKKKVIGVASSNHDVTSKKSNDHEPKSFRSSYEPFPEEIPWSLSSKKTTKPDDIISRSYIKPPITSDSTKRMMSPLVHDTKSYNIPSISKRDNLSDDDDSFNRKQKIKPTMPTINKPTSTYKKPTLSMYGTDDNDDEDHKNSSLNRRSNVSIPTTVSTIPKKPYKHDDDADDVYSYLKKTTTKTFGSDDESKNKTNINKNYQRTPDRFNPTTDYHGTVSKPPGSPSITASRSKLDDDDFPSSSLSKPLNRSKFNKDDHSSTLTKPATSTRFYDDDDEDDRLAPMPKITTHSKYNDDSYKSTSKTTPRSRYDDDDRLSPIPKITTHSKYNDDSYKSTSKTTAHSRYDDDDRLSPIPKITTHSKYNDDSYKSTSKTTAHSRYDDDDDDLPPVSKPIARGKYDSDTRSSSALKTTPKSKYEDDDDDDLPSKPATRSHVKDNDRSSIPAKSPARWNSDDDDYGTSKKPTTRSRYDDDDDDDAPSSKAITRGKYDSDYRPSSALKSTPKSKYEDDDDDDLPSKPAFRSKFDDDDSPPSSKKNNYSSRDDDYSGNVGARSRFGKDDFDSSKGGFNSGRAVSASTNRFKINSKSDT